MKILVTGATGFLGSHIVKRLLNDGNEIVILKRHHSDTHRIQEILPAISSFDIDGDDLNDLFQKHAHIDTIVHTATLYGRKGEKSFEIFKTNTAFPLRLIESAISFGVKSFFNTDTSLTKYLNSYSLSKKHFAEWGRLLAEQKKIRFINVELEHFYGPGDNDSKFTTTTIRSCKNNAPHLDLTPGMQMRDFIYIDDVVSAYTILLQEESKQPAGYQTYGLGSGKPISIRDFVETVRGLTHATTVLNFGAIPYRENEVMLSCASIEPLIKLGWRPLTDLQEGIEKTIRGELRQ